MVILFSLFFLITFIYIAKRDFIFSLFYLVLFIYTIFTEIAHIYFPGEIFLAFGGQVFELGVFYKYKLFVFFSFLSIFIIFCFLFRKKNKNHTFIVVKSTTSPLFRNILFIYIILAYNFLMLFLLFNYYSELSYLTQGVFKGSTLFRNSYAFAPIVIMVLYVKTVRLPTSFSKNLFFILLLITLFIYLSISTRAGGRGGIASLALGFLTYKLLQYPRLKLKQKVFMILKSIPIILLIILILNALLRIRTEGAISVLDFVFTVFLSPRIFLKELFSFKGIILQDYAGPSLTLFLSIQCNIVNFFDSLKSIFLNSLVFTGYPTLGFTLSRIANPMLSETWQGYGYYFLTEGYNVMGWGGFLYNAVVFNLGLYIWSKFTNTNDNNFKLFMNTMIVMQVISIVRSQSSEFIRATYLVFVPAIILYFLATGYRPHFIKRKLK